MRIRLSEFRRIVQRVIKEQPDARTVSAQLSPKEREMSSEVPKTALNPKHRPGQGNPAHQKAKMVAQVLQKRGLTQDANNKKAATQNLIPFIEKMDPSDALVMTADDIADQFAAKFFQKH